MHKFYPSSRAALAAFLFATVLIAGTAALLVSRDSKRAAEVSRQELISISSAVAAMVDERSSSISALRDSRLASLVESNRLAGIAVLDGRGRIVSASDRATLGGLNWSALLANQTQTPDFQVAVWDGEKYAISLQRTGSGLQVAALRVAGNLAAPADGSRLAMVLGAVVLWLLLGLAFGFVAIQAGRNTVRRMEALTHQLVSMDRFDAKSAERHLSASRPLLGGFVRPVALLAEALKLRHDAHVESRNQIAALFQINPHYVLLCTLNGHIVDANPAFYAMTGLPFEAIRGQRIEALNEVMPLEPLFELARRSLRENSSISGIEYALINRDDVRRAVQVSLRAVTVENEPAVLIQATDVANQRNLEHRISTYSDALDLMVDQRVAQLTAGNASINRLLDEAGVLMAAFDDGGSTRRWNPATETLTGRTIQQVPHFIAFTSVLGLSASEKKEFHEWFWGAKGGSYTVDVFSPSGVVHRILWRKGVMDEVSARGRVLLGMEYARAESHAGDGRAGSIPDAARVHAAG